MKALVFVGLTQILLSSYGQEICSNRDISNERRFQMQELEGLWYHHINEDNTFFNNIIPTDSKFYFMTFGDNAIDYFYGRVRSTNLNQSGPGCTGLIFLNRQRTPGSPCVLVQLISPELARESEEFIFSLLPGNDQLLLSFCQNPPSCTIRVAGVFTRRRRLCPGERELFLQNFSDLNIPATFNTQLQPTSNDCSMPGLENVRDKRSRSCRQVTRDALRQVKGLTQDKRYRQYRY